MKVWIKGGGALELSRHDFVAKGGQGAVYAKGGVAAKIYRDPAAALPAGKLGELAAITDPRVIVPQQLLCDRAGAAIGYTMRLVEGAHALCKLFPRAFRQRERIGFDCVRRLAEKLREVVDAVHRAGVLVVDLNEMNVLVGERFDDVFLIDADSFQTPRYRATALMESIRDRHAAVGSFDRDTDWFAYAVVSFQMFTGVHPYKGKHPRVVGLDARMKANLSVFDKSVSVPRAAYPVDVIPDGLRRWYKDTFQRGLRCPPPDDTGTVVYVPKALPPSGNSVELTELFRCSSDIERVWYHDGRVAVATDRELFLDGHRIAGAPDPVAEVGFEPRTGKAFAVGRTDGVLSLYDIAGRQPIALTLRASATSSSGGRVYAHSGRSIFELVVVPAGNRLVASARPVCNVLPRATALYRGVVFQNVLGGTIASLLPAPSESYQLRIPELDDYHIVDAAFDRTVLVVTARPVGVHGHRVDRFTFRTSKRFDAYDVRVEEDVADAGVDMVTLDSGVCLSRTGGGELEIFDRRRGRPHRRVVDDDALTAGVLAKAPGRALICRGDAVCRMTLR